MSEFLDIDHVMMYSNEVIHMERRTYNPSTKHYDNGSEIRISINQQDLLILLHKSYLHIEGKVLNKTKNQPFTANQAYFTNNAAAFLFDSIKYEINGVEIDNLNNPGISSTIKNYLSLNKSEQYSNASWQSNGENGTIHETGFFSFNIPLSMLLGVAEDFTKMIVYARHDFVFIRSRSDENCLIISEDAIMKEGAIINLNKVQLRIQHLTISDVEKLKLYKHIQNGKSYKIPYRSWSYCELPVLQTTSNIWSVKTTTQMEKPRYIIVGFQTNRKNQLKANCSKFDSANITDLKVFLNSEKYPYDDLNLNFNINNFGVLYDMYVDFQTSYYGKIFPEPCLSMDRFKNDAPLFVIDCSRQNDSIKAGTVDVRIEVQSSTNMPEKTSAYCLILHDRIIEYNPLTNIVKKLV